jgi:hypothetical protein
MAKDFGFLFSVVLSSRHPYDNLLQGYVLNKKNSTRTTVKISKRKTESKMFRG